MCTLAAAFPKKNLSLAYTSKRIGCFVPGLGSNSASIVLMKTGLLVFTTYSVSPIIFHHHLPFFDMYSCRGDQFRVREANEATESIESSGRMYSSKSIESSGRMYSSKSIGMYITSPL